MIQECELSLLLLLLATHTLNTNHSFFSPNSSQSPHLHLLSSRFTFPVSLQKIIGYPEILKTQYSMLE